MKLNLSIFKFVERFIPVHKRTENRVKWLRFLLEELRLLWAAFTSYRTDFYYFLNISGQTMLLQAHLNKYVPGADNSIAILHRDDFGLFVQREDEAGVAFIEVGIAGVEEDDFEYAAMMGEEQESFAVHFRVMVPSGVNVNIVDGIIKTYKLAGKTYEIIQN